MDLHAWITQQVDRDEALAKAATPGPWEGVVDHHQRGEVNASVWSDSLGYYITEKISSGDRHEADAHHIGANGPDVVLRRCEADRRILARHRLDPGEADSPMYTTACKGCQRWGEFDYPNTENLNDCPELLDLGYAHGLTDEILAGLDRPQPPEPKPRIHNERSLADILRIATPEFRAELIRSENARERLRQDRDEARTWARHGYEIGQKHCGWTDHGVAPDWLTEGWPPRIDACEHLKRAADYDEALTRVRAAVARLRTTTPTWEPAANLIEAAINGEQDQQ